MPTTEEIRRLPLTGKSYDYLQTVTVHKLSKEAREAYYQWFVDYGKVFNLVAYLLRGERG